MGDRRPGCFVIAAAVLAAIVGYGVYKLKTSPPGSGWGITTGVFYIVFLAVVVIAAVVGIAKFLSRHM